MLLFLVCDAAQVGLVLDRDSGTAVDPAVVRSQVLRQTHELAASGKMCVVYTVQLVPARTHLIGLPKYCEAAPRVAPNMHSALETL